MAKFAEVGKLGRHWLLETPYVGRGVAFCRFSINDGFMDVVVANNGDFASSAPQQRWQMATTFLNFKLVGTEK